MVETSEPAEDRLRLQQEILDKLDAITEDVRTIRRQNEFIEANATTSTETITRISKVVADHEDRLIALEATARIPQEHGIPHAPRIASFTSEFTDRVGESIRAAAMAQAPALESITNASINQVRATKLSMLSQIVTGILLTLVIIVYIIFGGGHH